MSEYNLDNFDMGPVVGLPPNKSRYVTRDSGERHQFDSGMQRDTSTGKPRYDLIPYEMLRRWADLYARGAEKYDERNWEKAGPAELIPRELTPELERFKESAFRHFVDWFYGKNVEEDHAAAVLWNVAAYEEIKHRINVSAHGLDYRDFLKGSRT